MNAHVNMKPIVNSCFVIAFFFSPQSYCRPSARPTPIDRPADSIDQSPSSSLQTPPAGGTSSATTSGRNTPDWTTSGGKRHAPAETHSARPLSEVPPRRKPRPAGGTPNRNPTKGKLSQGNHQAEARPREPARQKLDQGDSKEDHLSAGQQVNLFTHFPFTCGRSPTACMPHMVLRAVLPPSHCAGEHFPCIPWSPAEEEGLTICPTEVFRGGAPLYPVGWWGRFPNIVGTFRKRKIVRYYSS